MFSVLSLTTERTYAFIIVLLSILCCIFYVNGENVKIDFAKYKEKIAVDNQNNEKNAREKEILLQKKVDQVSENVEKREIIFNRRVASDNISVISLRNTISKFRADECAKNTISSSSPNVSTTQGVILGYCAGEYTKMAENADKLKNQVIGLQEYAESIKQE